ncbi:MAG: extracellular solute-binding protein [bacterium]
MKNLLIIILVVLLGLSWVYFWICTRPTTIEEGEDRSSGQKDVIHVWVNELVGSPDEVHYYELADCWNATHPNLQVKMTVMSHAGYDSKLRIAIASGQPPDVCMGGLVTFESLRYSGKTTDLAVPIPKEFLPQERIDAMGPVFKKFALRDGQPFIFPVYRYCYAGVLLTNRTMLQEAGFDDKEINQKGWTFEQFREACRKITKDTNGDGTPDVWGFGAALVHFKHLFLYEFGPGVWGRDVTERTLVGFDESTGRWARHPKLTEDQLYELFLLFYQLFNVDKTWNPSLLGMTIHEILDEVVTHRRLAMTFGEVPWAPKLRHDIWEMEISQGAKNKGELPDLTSIWMPTLHPGDRPAPRAGILGFSILKQTPYKGDAHTRNALRVALFLTHPAHLARSQFRMFRHLPPEPGRFGRIFPELIQVDDPWVKYYNEMLDSDVPFVPPPLSSDTPDPVGCQKTGIELDRWIEKTGMDYLQQVVYEKMSPREAAKRFYEGIQEVCDKAYADMEG